MTRFALVILNYKYPHVTGACLESLARTDRTLFTLYLVDNSHEDGAETRLSEAMVRLGIEHKYLGMLENRGFAGGVNAGLKAALADGFDWVALLNNDTQVLPDFAVRVSEAASAHPGTVLAGSILDEQTGRPSYGIGRLSPWTLQAIHILDEHYAGPIDFASGCFMAIPRKALERAGVFREEYFMYAEDLEFCLRLRRAGIPMHFDPSIRIRHHVGTTSDLAGLAKDYYRIRNQTDMVMTHGSILQKSLYAAYLFALTAYQIRSPRTFKAFALGIRDALAGRLGKRN